MTVTVPHGVIDVAGKIHREVELSALTGHHELLLAETAPLYQKLAVRKGVEFNLDVDETFGGEIMVDPERMKTVLGNLMDNAVKYCRTGERVRVAVEQTSRNFTYVVEDNGQGLPKDELSKLFVRFGRGSSKPTNEEPSTGLGLAIAKEIVQAHGGQITVTGDQGIGLTFRVILPYHGKFAVASSAR